MFTTFNRKEKTLSCLKSLRAQILPEGWRIEIFQTDDASKDGTAEAVQEQFPEVHLYKGNGSLFWAGGMRFTWKKALETTADYYLLINDDTDLASDAITSLVNTSRGTSKPALVIGSTKNQHTGDISYGGWKLTSKGRWQSERIVPADNNAKDCDFGNANILLVPSEVVEKIGILADHFTHSLADYDYTLKAKKAGYPVMVAPGYLGVCIDDHGNNWKSQRTSLKERIAYLKSPKGLAYSEYLRFIREHFPSSYPSAFAKLWMKTFFPFIWDSLKK